jgi:hypothetical protein
MTVVSGPTCKRRTPASFYPALQKKFHASVSMSISIETYDAKLLPRLREVVNNINSNLKKSNEKISSIVYATHVLQHMGIGAKPWHNR